MTGDLLRRGIPVDAIFAVNDAMALGVLTFLRDAGRPIAVAGFDDIKALRDVTPSLTTVHLPWDQVADEALTLAMGPLGDEPRTLMIEGHVVVRESTPPLTQ
jgi:LacI family transcriptional regulator